jgi:hypothetical protein
MMVIPTFRRIVRSPELIALFPAGVVTVFFYVHIFFVQVKITSVADQEAKSTPIEGDFGLPPIKGRSSFSIKTYFGKASQR